MAIVYSTGFDIFANISEFLETGFYRESITQNDFSTTDGRFGGGCLKGTLTSGSNGWYGSSNAAAGAAMFWAFAYYHNSGTTTDTLFLLTNYGTQQAARIAVSSTGVLQSYNRSDALVETSVSNPLTAGTWHWVEIKVISGTGAADGEITVRVDNSTVLNLTNLDTRPGGTAQTTGIFKISGPRSVGGADVRIDDFFLMNTSGSAFNAFMTDRRIQTLIPTADAATVNWTASAGTDVSCVDDALGASNGDTDYIASNTVAQESRFAMGNLSVSPASIDAVVVQVRARKADAGDRTMRALINSNATEATGTTLGLSTDYIWKSSGAFLTNPDGAVAWTESAVNALEAGVEIVA